MAIINRIRIILHLDRAEVARNVELNNMLGLAGKHMYSPPHNDFENSGGIVGGCLLNDTLNANPNPSIWDSGHSYNHVSHSH